MDRGIFKIIGVIIVVTVALVFAIRMSQSAVDALIGVVIGIAVISPIVGAYFYYRGVEDGIRRCQEMQGTRIIREPYQAPSYPPTISAPYVTNYQAPISFAQAKSSQPHTIE